MKTTNLMLAAILSAFIIPMDAYASETDKETESVLFSYCSGEGLGGWACSGPSTWGGAMLFTKDLSARFDGCRITAVQIANGSFDTQTEAPFQLFFTTDLNGENPFVLQDEQMDIDRPYEFKEYTLKNPVKIAAGDEFYVGYSIYVLESNFWEEDGAIYYNRGMIQDDSALGYPGCFIRSCDGDVRYPYPYEGEWEDHGSTAQVAIKLRIEGEGVRSSMMDIAFIGAATYVSPGEETRYMFKLVNSGTEEIQSVDCEYGYGGDEKTHRTFQLGGLKPNNDFCWEVYDSTDRTGLSLDWTFAVTAIDGVPVREEISATHTIRSFPYEDGFTKVLVTEEGTGEGCGWCPRGLAEVEQMMDEHPDGTFIPIAVHCRYYDEHPNYAPSYQPIWDNYLFYTPEMMHNREALAYGLSTGNCSWIYEDLKSVAAIAKVNDLNVDFREGAVTASASVEFAFDEDNVDYRLAFVVTENNVEGIQYNSYSGWDAPVGGWESLPQLVLDYRHMHMARSISDYWGHEGSIPSDVRAGEAYGYSAQLDMSRVIDPNECDVIALVINGKTNAIENAKTVRMSDFTAVSAMDPEEDGEILYYDLSGHIVATPLAPGLYIRRQGGGSTKILVK